MLPAESARSPKPERRARGTLVRMRMVEAETGHKRIASAAVPGVELMGIDHMRAPHRCVKERFSVAWMLAGRAVIVRGGRTRSYEAGAILVSQMGDVHNDRRIDSPLSYRIASFDDTFVKQARASLGLSVRGDLALGEIDTKSPQAESIRRMHRTLFSPDALVAQQEEAIGDGLRALLALAQKRCPPAGPREAKQLVRRAQDFMRERRDDALRIQDAATAAGVDQFRLIRAFKQHVGMSPYEWLTHLRIQRAKALLVKGHTAADVAQQLGYCDQSQLHRHFRRIVGTTPGAYARALSVRRYQLHESTPSDLDNR